MDVTRKSPAPQIDLEEAREAVLAMARRVALLHMAYARTLVDALGEEQGQALVCKAISAYGARIGERTRARVEALGHDNTAEAFALGSDLSPLGFPSERVVVEGEVRTRSHTCVLAEVWREYGEELLGSLYCLVDPAKMQAYNPALTMVHTHKLPNGEPYCEMAVRPITAAEDGE
jgi:predicted ArsR family transcriptional regulator